MEISLKNVNKIFLKKGFHSLLLAFSDIRKYAGCPMRVNFPVSHSFLNFDSQVSLKPDEVYHLTLLLSYSLAHSSSKPLSYIWCGTCFFEMLNVKSLGVTFDTSSMINRS